MTTLPTDVVHRLTFSSETIKRLSLDDFNIDSRELITLKHNDCILILFHIENIESYQLANILALVAQQVAGPILSTEHKVAEAFIRLKSDGSHPLHWTSLRQYPFIMTYRKGWPVAIYNGPRKVQALIDYALTLACEAGYYEIVQAEDTNILDNPFIVRRELLQYTNETPIRKFNPVIPITGAAIITQPTTRTEVTDEPV